MDQDQEVLEDLAVLTTGTGSKTGKTPGIRYWVQGQTERKTDCREYAVQGGGKGMNRIIGNHVPYALYLIPFVWSLYA
jgi:hypothetical protein